MGDLKFTIADEAATFIVEALRVSRSHPAIGEMMPALGLVLSYQRVDDKGRIVESYSQPFIEVGWQQSEVLLSEGYVAIQVRGQGLFLEPDTLKHLKGRRLILDTVDVGVPVAAGKKRHLLRIA